MTLFIKKKTQTNKKCSDLFIDDNSFSRMFYFFLQSISFKKPYFSFTNQGQSGFSCTIPGTDYEKQGLSRSIWIVWLHSPSAMTNKCSCDLLVCQTYTCATYDLKPLSSVKETTASFTLTWIHLLNKNIFNCMTYEL